MDTFIVHVYRRPVRDSDEFVGIVQRIESANTTAFRSQGQLLEILLAEPPTRSHQVQPWKASNKLRD